MIRVGIDSGMDGAIVALNDAHHPVVQMQMPTIDVGVRRKARKWEERAEKAIREGKKPPPKTTKGKKRIYDLVEINRIFRTLKEQDEDLYVIMEQIQTRQGESASTALTAGKGFGGIEGILVAHGIPYDVTMARQWQLAVLKGVEGNDTKARAVLCVQRRVPGLVLPKAKKKKEGQADATCMALHGEATRPAEKPLGIVVNTPKPRAVGPPPPPSKAWKK
tara:strand:+ start:190 stop:849 length:660 start_codon:yes stop_codon:yes gene_type:complete